MKPRPQKLPTLHPWNRYGYVREMWSVSWTDIQRTVARTPLALWRRWLGLAPKIGLGTALQGASTDDVFLPGHTQSPRHGSGLSATPAGIPLTDAQAIAQDRGLLAVLRTVEEAVSPNQLAGQISGIALMREMTAAWPHDPRRIKRWLLDLGQCPALWGAVRWPDADTHPDELWAAALRASPVGAPTDGQRHDLGLGGRAAAVRAGASAQDDAVFPSMVLGPSIIEIPKAPTPLWEAWLAHGRRYHFGAFQRAEIRAAARANPVVASRVMTTVWDAVLMRSLSGPYSPQWHTWTRDVDVLHSFFTDAPDDVRQVVALLGTARITRLGHLLHRNHAATDLGQGKGRRELTTEEQSLLGRALAALDEPATAAELWQEVARTCPGDIITPLGHLLDGHLAALQISRFDVRQLLRHRDREVRVIAMRLLSLSEAASTPTQAPVPDRTPPDETGPSDAPAAHHPAIARYLARAKSRGLWPQA